MKRFYETNQDFREYVDRYCAKHKITAEEAIEHQIVKEVGKAYKTRMKKGEKA